MLCPNCNQENPNAAKFCCNCGKPFSLFLKCLKCNSNIPLDSKFCPDCGITVESLSKTEINKQPVFDTKQQNRNDAYTYINQYKSGYILFADRNKLPYEKEKLSDDEILKVLSNKFVISQKIVLSELTAWELDKISAFNPKLPIHDIPKSLFGSDPHIFGWADEIYYISDDFRSNVFHGTILSSDKKTAKVLTQPDGHPYCIEVYHPNGQLGARMHLYSDTFMELQSTECYNTYGLRISWSTFVRKFYPRYESQIDSACNFRRWGLDFRHT